jgi:hypothetical protein
VFAEDGEILDLDDATKILLILLVNMGENGDLNECLLH